MKAALLIFFFKIVYQQMPEGQVLTKPYNYFSRLYNLHRLVILANKGKLARQLYSLPYGDKIVGTIFYFLF